MSDPEVREAQDWDAHERNSPSWWRRTFPDGYWAWWRRTNPWTKGIVVVVYAAFWYLLTLLVVVPYVDFRWPLSAVAALLVWLVLDTRVRWVRLKALEAGLLSSRQVRAAAVVELLNRPRAAQWEWYRQASAELGLPDPGPYVPESM